jgi:hypothetical protein
MQQPFTSQQFFEVFRHYNLSVWPVQLLLMLGAIQLAASAIGSPRLSRYVVSGIAAFWVWMALAYHLAFLAKLTPAAYGFAALFLAEAALLAWHGLRTRRLRFTIPMDRRARIAGLTLVLFALLGYPALAHALGQRYPAVPTFGLPCPTTIFTFGLLTWAVRPIPRSVLVIPTAWALLGTVAALQFGAREDFSLIPAALLALSVMLRPQSRERRMVPRVERAFHVRV